ncbi:hypothetical protein FOZ62_017706 [Perkinsus olseni]|uniref:Uncharacterized protein n=1 Tax=Perkinsus olseni TaxID=32597 RepID=A0A7J6SFX3_PEROL|nr:hypothetical protein FOZ62_017706 [Perkinsus olseni]
MAFPPPGGMAPSLFPAPHQWGMDFNVMSAITGELRRLPPIPEESALSSSRSASQTLVDWAERTLAPEWKDLEDECWSTDCSGGDLWEDPRVAPQELRKNGGPLTIVRTHPRDRGDRSRSIGEAAPSGPTRIFQEQVPDHGMMPPSSTLASSIVPSVIS